MRLIFGGGHRHDFRTVRLPAEDHFYFVHSFYAAPTDRSVTAIEASYPDPFCAMIWDDKNLFATQFHPEKSQADGLRILKNFAEL